MMAAAPTNQQWSVPADMPEHLKTMVLATGPVPSTTTNWLVGKRNALVRRGAAKEEVYSFYLLKTGEELDATFYTLTKKPKGATDPRGVIVINGPSFLFPVIIAKTRGVQMYRPWRGANATGQDPLGYEDWQIAKTVGGFDNIGRNRMRRRKRASDQEEEALEEEQSEEEEDTDEEEDTEEE